MLAMRALQSEAMSNRRQERQRQRLVIHGTNSCWNPHCPELTGVKELV